MPCVPLFRTKRRILTISHVFDYYFTLPIVFCIKYVIIVLKYNFNELLDV